VSVVLLADCTVAGSRLSPAVVSLGDFRDPVDESGFPRRFAVVVDGRIGVPALPVGAVWRGDARDLFSCLVTPCFVDNVVSLLNRVVVDVSDGGCNASGHP
jgi:hypothetical protein